MIGVMGGISLLCAIIIISLYSERIFTNQKYYLEELIRQEVNSLTAKNATMLQDIALRMQYNPSFKNAFYSLDFNELTAFANDEFSQYYISVETIVINKIFIFDENYTLITSSNMGDDYNIHGLICPEIIAIAKKRTGSSRIMSFESLCSHDGHVFNSTIIPIGSLRPVGYIQILSDPIYYLKIAEQKLNMPLRIQGVNKKTLYENPNWKTSDPNSLLLQNSILNKSGERMLTLFMYRDIRDIRNSFGSTRNLIIVVVTLVTILAVLIFLVVFNRVMVKPLYTLTNKFALIANDKKQLGIALPLEGSQEIVHLTSCFNEMHNELSGLYQSLERTAFTDQLTALPNRTKLQEILSFHASLNRRKNIPFTLFMMDLDKFKLVNDTLGHHVGDLLLQQVSDRLRNIIRKGDYITLITEQDSALYDIDIIARLGGDEFAAIFPQLNNVKEAAEIARKIITTMKEPFVLEGNSPVIGISIGIVLCPIHGRDPDLLMQHADVAMYEAKNKQTGFSFYDAELDQYRIDMLTLEDELHLAIKNEELKLVYQPKIELLTNRVVGVEVLVRWNHPEHGEVSPHKFIPIAEQSGLINNITRWVISAAFSQKKAWDAQNLKITMAINLSARNLVCSSLLEHVKNELEHWNIEPNSIFFEITETSVMSDPERSLVALQNLKSMGVRLSVDDFGTGYSSLIYLKKLPVDEIKIDRSFVMEMQTNENDAIIVQSTIDLAHNMGLSVTAEGVESRITLQQLKEKKSDYAQGFFICKPASSEDFEKWLADSDWNL